MAVEFISASRIVFGLVWLGLFRFFCLFLSLIFFGGLGGFGMTYSLRVEAY